MYIQPIEPIQHIKNLNDKYYTLDGTTLYNKATGHTEKDITEMSFEEILNNLEVEK
jgi:hypothetical protein